MADFCAQCAHEMGFDCDFKGMMTNAEHDVGMVCSVLCEGCGWINVDGNGKCVYIGCLENHNPDLNIPVDAIVEKIKGYKFPGEIRSRFTNRKGDVKYVVECTTPSVEGMLHIYSPKQIRKVNE